MAVVLTEGVLDGCPSGTLIGARFGWSTYIATFLTEGTCFLTPKGGSPWESTESSLSTTTGSRYVRLFWPAVAPRGRVLLSLTLLLTSTSLRNASRAAADIIRKT